MEQFITPGKGAVYRYCTDDCPEPTPKLQRVFSSAPAGASKNLRDRADRAPFMSYNTDAVPMMAHSAVDVAQIQEDAHMESVVAEAEAYLRDHPLPLKNSEQVVVTPEGPPAPAMAEVLSATSIRLANAIKNSRPTASAPPTEPNLQADTSASVQLKTAITLQSVPTSVEKAPAEPKAKPFNTSRVEKSAEKEDPASKSVPLARNSVTFSGNRELLSESGKQAVNNMVEAAMDVDAINLRGYASNVGEEEEYYRLSVARALSVRAELVKAGVPREKIRILNPKIELVDPNNPLAAVNRSVVVMFRKSNASVAKLNAPKAQTLVSMPSAPAADISLVDKIRS